MGKDLSMGDQSGEQISDHPPWETAARVALRRLGPEPSHIQLMRLGSTALFRSGNVAVRVGGTMTEMRRNLRVADAFAKAGVPALRAIIDEPLDVDGLCVTVWPWVEGGSLPSSHWLGATARCLHDRSAEIGERLDHSGVPLGSFVDEETRKVRLRVSLAMARADGAVDVSPILERLADVELALADRDASAEVVVHGDLYQGNTVSDQGSTMLIDFDMVAVGPPSADAAPEVVRERRFPSSGASYQRFVDGYGAEPEGSELLEHLVLLREMTMVAWIAELSGRRPSVLSEARHRIHTLVAGEADRPWTAA
jgi:aminoglycoside phosphotransferase (APT) family kinase protein